MKHNDFECRQCGAHFNSRAELQRHNRDQHSQHGRSAAGSSSESQGSQQSGSSSPSMGDRSERYRDQE